jgi:uncharacterized protein with HEPN domain
MRELVRDPGRLEHILTAIDNVAQFLDGRTMDDLMNDKILFFAVVKNIEIVGEAANYISKELQVQHPEVAWRDVISMRHVLVHGYYQIDAVIAWKTATENLPPLRAQIESILKSITAE